ncbi:hypothetical protein chiPu_0007699 [Chiloscyllium punctatum]|uniref:Tetratricopeptide repeat-like domain-containing protein n=1 Tax=Chiloscyllium punctatum TaxID=137246 RepID=A0A401SFT7_CHIPU|nr:hypothetical protein [Chiloscyllium punctatum]
MAEVEPITLAAVAYYCQEKYFHHALTAANEGLMTCCNEPVLIFFKAFTNLMEDHDAIHELDRKLRECEKSAGEKALYYASMFLFLVNQHQEAREHTNRILKIFSGSKETLILKGWIELTDNNNGNVKKAISYLEEGLCDFKDIFGLMGKVCYLQKEQNFLSALDTVNQIIATTPTFMPALILKMKLFLAQNNWDQTLETAQRIMLKDGTNIDALLILCLHALCKEGDQTEAENYVKQLHSALEKKEPQNPKLYQRVAVLVSRMCGRNQTVLDQTYNLVERSLYMAPTDAEIATELGFQLFLQDKLQDAVKQYTAAMKLSETNMPALTGRIQVEILLGHLEDAEQQLELLKEVQGLIGTSAAVLALAKGEEPNVIIKFLNQAVDIHFSSFEDLPLGLEYYEKLNPEFMLDIVKKLLALCPDQHQATKVLQDAIHEFAGTPEETRITIANVDLALSQDNVETAFSMLRSILPKQPYYIEAQKKLAEIYLHKQKDQKLYIRCYKDLHEKFPNTQISLLLGDAYIAIQEPEKAIEVYEQVLKKNPHDGHLVRKIGQALVKTHHYTKAIHYFETAVKISGQDFLCYDLAELLLKLRLFDKAKKVLRKALEHDFKNDLATMMNDVKYLMLLAKICKKTNEVEEAMTALTKAYNLQGRLLKRLMMEQLDIIPAEKQLAGSICAEIAHISMDLQDYDKAIYFYKEGLSFVENDPKLMIELAQLYLAKEDSDMCEHLCIKLLKNVQNNNDVNMMMADLMFSKQEYEHAIFYYRQLLQRSPDNFLVLSKLIMLFRTTGKLDKAPVILELAERISTRTIVEPGFNYCRGLYLWYIGQPNGALKHFNKARKDSEWGQRSIYNMIQICLNPDNEIVGSNLFETLDEEFSGESTEKKETDQLAVRTAEKLLKEYHPQTQEEQEQRILLQNSCLMATNDRSKVEKALDVFTEMASVKKDHVPSLLAVAQACMVLKLIPRARNQLKRITKINWNLKDAEEFEKSWLLLADIYIKTGKYDLATELLKRCIQYNQAYEYLGLIMEKEQSYMDAVINYKLAWKCNNEANPAIGYKLAFNYLKAKMYMHAIDICHKVLKNHPTYPKIRKEVFEKARASIKQ